METMEELRGHIIDTVVREIPKGFLMEFGDRVLRAYDDTFESVNNSPTVLHEQRLSRLRALRPFRMDWELVQAASSWGLSVSAEPLAENDWKYAYAVSGSFGLTQSYVQKLGALPRPAKFRDQLANYARMPRLEFDNPSEIYEPRNFYGLLAHNPVGWRFDKDHQKLGSLQFCVPFGGMSGWAFEMSVSELVSRYPVVTEKVTTDESRSPKWKPAVKTKDDVG